MATKKKKKAKGGIPIASVENHMMHFPDNDAHTLAEADAIKKDPVRLKAASEAAKKMVKEKTDKLAGLKKVAKSAPKKKKKQ